MSKLNDFIMKLELMMKFPKIKTLDLLGDDDEELMFCMNVSVFYILLELDWTSIRRAARTDRI